MKIPTLLNQTKKVLEVYEQSKQRIGVVIVGPPQTGKSTVCAILKSVIDFYSIEFSILGKHILVQADLYSNLRSCLNALN